MKFGNPFKKKVWGITGYEEEKAKLEQRRKELGQTIKKEQKIAKIKKDIANIKAARQRARGPGILGTITKVISNIPVDPNLAGKTLKEQRKAQIKRNLKRKNEFMEIFNNT